MPVMSCGAIRIRSSGDNGTGEIGNKFGINVTIILEVDTI
jgi:hypothetical protein